MLARIIKNLAFSGILAGLIGIVTGIVLMSNGQVQANFFMGAGFLVFIASFLASIYFHNRNIHVERWGLFLGLAVAIALFVLESIFFSVIFGVVIALSTIFIVFLYIAIARRVLQYKIKQRKK